MGEKTNNNRHALMKHMAYWKSLRAVLQQQAHDLSFLDMWQEKRVHRAVRFNGACNSIQGHSPSIWQSAVANRSVEVIFTAYIFERWT